MIKKFIKYCIIIVCLASAIYASLVSYVLFNTDIKYLIVNCLNPENNRFPPGLPEFYLLHFRGNKQDLESLRKGKGLSFILSSETGSQDQVLEIATFFLNKGIDINLIGFDGLTALHTAILLNQPNYVSFLLKNGADISIGVDFSYIYGKKEKSKMFGMDAIKFASYVSGKDKKDRSAIIEILSQYTKN
jgi:ankyrin repeat protein